jgi:anti-sigma regulatory factor (Ser/Thr protein kinase)
VPAASGRAQPENARQFVTRLAEDRHVDSSTVALVTPELVTNAIAHARGRFVVEVNAWAEIGTSPVLTRGP